MRRILWIVLGCVGVGLGAVGAVLPLLPAFPFLLLAAFSFAKSSERLHTWFINTSLYKKNLESYVQHRAMTWRTKRRIMLTVTVLMALWLCDDDGERAVHSLRHFGGSVGVPHPVLYLWGEDPGGAPGGLTNIQNRKEQLPRA